MREWRKTHKLSGPALDRAHARNTANVYQRRKKLLKKPCEVCGTTKDVQKHHDDYTQPLKVRWHCRKDHLALHGFKCFT